MRLSPIAATSAAIAAAAASPQPDSLSTLDASIQSAQPSAGTGSSGQQQPPPQPAQAAPSPFPTRVASPAPPSEQPVVAREPSTSLGEAAVAALRSLSRPLSAVALAHPSSATSPSLLSPPAASVAAALPRSAAAIIGLWPSPRAAADAGQTARRAEEERVLETIFTELDRDSNGFIGRTDVLAVLRDMGLQSAVTDAVVTAMLEMGCSEGAVQQLSFRQFRSMQRQYGIT